MLTPLAVSLAILAITGSLVSAFALTRIAIAERHDAFRSSSRLLRPVLALRHEGDSTHES